MQFFKKVGRPSDEEQMMIEAIANVIEEKGLGIEQVPDCYNYEDLVTAMELLEATEPQVIEQGNEPEQEVEPVEHTESPEPVQEIEPEAIQEEEPEQTIEATETNEEEVAEVVKDLPEPNTEEVAEQVDQLLSNADTEEILSELGELPDFTNQAYDPFAEQVIERSYNTTSSEPSEANAADEDLNLDEAKDTPLSEPQERTKKRAAEQTADAILKGYSKIVPEPFKWWCKFPESKIEKMNFTGELDPKIEVEDGLTFEDYMRQTNESIDQIFEVQEETVDEIREPLIEVLMEQEMELTPQQRLTMAVASHLIQMFTMAMKLWGQNKRILEYQKHLTNVVHRANAA